MATEETEEASDGRDKDESFTVQSMVIGLVIGCALFWIGYTFRLEMFGYTFKEWFLVASFACFGSVVTGFLGVVIVAIRGDAVLSPTQKKAIMTLATIITAVPYGLFTWGCFDALMATRFGKGTMTMAEIIEYSEKNNWLRVIGFRYVWNRGLVGTTLEKLEEEYKKSAAAEEPDSKEENSDSGSKMIVDDIDYNDISFEKSEELIAKWVTLGDRNLTSVQREDKIKKVFREIKGAKVVVRGGIENVSVSSSWEQMLGVPSGMYVAVTNDMVSVNAFVPASMEDSASSLRSGEAVVITGRIFGWKEVTSNKIIELSRFFNLGGPPKCLYLSHGRLARERESNE